MIVESFGLSLRLFCCAAIALYALSKLVRLPSSATEVWTPVVAPRRLIVVLVSAVGMVELSFALVTVVNPARWALFSASLLLGLLLSVYGTASIKRTGNCGCGRPQALGQHPRRLWARNLALFGGAALGCAVGPTSAQLTSNIASSVAWTGMVPGAIAGTAFLYRALSVGWPSATDRPAWPHWRVWRSLTTG